MSPVSVSSIGEYIRQQREQAKISLRQLASAAGVSNPYLSQVERGLRRPSAEILQQIAKGLRISAEALYVQAGILEDRQPDSGVRAAVLADPELTERQKQVLLEIYESFRRETTLNVQASSGTAPQAAAAGNPSPDADPGSADPGAEGPGTAGPGTAGPGTAGPGTAGSGAPGTAGRGSAGRAAAGSGGRSARRTRSTGTRSTGTRSTGRGSTGTGSTGTGSTGTGSAPATGQAAGTAYGADGKPGGTDQESSGAEAPAHNAQGPARTAGQGR
ncbi:MAG TPA: helix-turn-helix domain-containing protein [Streptosporangiaceae bacterium]|nr:helix-turn-helix domain-containing protein [Streptosporangiaceae bacterium]